MLAEHVKIGDFIMSFGRVADIRRFEGSIAFFTKGGQQLSRGYGEAVQTAGGIVHKFLQRKAKAA